MKPFVVSSVCLVAFLVLVVATGDSSFAANPGAKATLSKDGINHIIAQTLPLIIQEVQSVSIPDVNGSAGTPVGSIDYSLSAIHITGFSIASITLDLQPPNRVVVTANGLSISLHLNWHYKEHSFPHISDSGSADASTKGSSFQVSTVLSNSNGKPAVGGTTCSVNLNDFDIDLHGGASWLYQLFVNIFSSNIKHSVQDNVSQAVVQAVNQQAEKALASLNLIVQIDKTASVDFSMVGDPTITGTYITIPDKGEFYLNSGHTESPYVPGPLPDTIDSSMLQFLIDEYVLDSAGYVYQQGNVLQTVITQKDIPSTIPIKLNTASFKVSIPQLYNAFPDQDMELGVASTAAPTAVVTSANGVNITWHGDVDVRVLFANGTSTSAFVIGADAATDAQAWITGTVLNFKLGFVHADLRLESTHIGNLNVSSYTPLVNDLLSEIVVPLINQIVAGKGLPIPTVDGLTFVNPEVKFSDGFLFVATNINYNPSGETAVKPKTPMHEPHIPILISHHQEE